MDIDKETALHLFRQMLLIRRFEERSAEMYTRGYIKGFLHLYIGQEAVAVGVFSVLGENDYIVTHYRDHGHALARGIEARSVMAELFGKATGVSRGKGGSMHLFDARRNFLGGYAIVAGGMPIACGLAFATAYREENRVTLSILGDGAINEGEFHESLVMASLWKLPVFFLLENNGYGMGTPVQEAFPLPDLYKMAGCYGVTSSQVDGMDVLAVREAARRALDHVRSGKGPYFLEAITYRFRGHSMADPMLYREKSEEDQWMKRDPIANFSRYLKEKGWLTESEAEAMNRAIEEEIGDAVRFAQESPLPTLETLYEDIYA